MVQVIENEVGSMVEHYPDCTIHYKGNVIHKTNGPAITFVNEKIAPQFWVEGIPVTDVERKQQMKSVVVPFPRRAT